MLPKTYKPLKSGVGPTLTELWEVVLSEPANMVMGGYIDKCSGLVANIPNGEFTSSVRGEQKPTGYCQA